ASLEFVDCSLAAYAGSDNYLPPEGSTEEEEVPNLLLENITVKAEDLGTYGILSGRGTNLTNAIVSVANKELFGIRTGNLLMMTDVDIRVRDIGHTGIYASGSGYFMRSGILKVVNTGNTGLAAPSIGHIEGGGIIIDNSGMAMTGGQYFSMEGGTLTITNAEYGLFSSLTGIVSGGSIRIDAEGFAMNTGKTVVSGGDIVLHSENGFALLAAGQGDRTAGFTMEGGTIDARSEGHAAFLSVYGVNFWDPQEILLPEGGKFMSEDLEDLGVRIITITDKDTEKVSVDYVYTFSGPQILDIAGGADHVILKPMINAYEVISGDGSTWAKGSPDGLEIVIRGEPEDGKTFDRFMYAFLDQAMLDSDNFEVKEGSLVLTLKPGYLETLSEGEHHLKVVFSDDGAAEAVFTVTAGGESWIWYAAALALAALICIFLGKNLATLS
ncbi:MAG: hypothetical protein J6U26_05365, partial [Lachnospiraceae bacterium]|nr:hypothetical protein [Lachnospiraceae bacterium]